MQDRITQADVPTMGLEYRDNGVSTCLFIVLFPQATCIAQNVCVVYLSGYCFLLFQEEISVQALIDACLADDSKLYWCVTSPTMKDKPVRGLMLLHVF